MKRILIWLIFSCPLVCHAQLIYTRVNESLNNFYQNYPHEKVYLQTDKQNYSQGDIVWFKAYLIHRNIPTIISNVLYVELIDSSGLILDRKTLSVKDGTSFGNISLSGNLPAGNYRIRAYTTWMMNFNSGFYFDHELPVGMKYTGRPILEKTDSSGYTLQFFPEGGNLVLGLTSKVAFKVCDSEMKGVDVTGKIVDSSGKTIAQISVVHDGLGSFIIHPMPQNYYKAIIDFPHGIRRTFPLPSAKESGIVLYARHIIAENGEDSLYFRISRSKNNKNAYQHLLLCAQVEGTSSFMAINFDTVEAGNYNNRILEAPTPLPLDNFSSPGVLQLTVFNDSGEVLAERLVFLRHERQQLNARLSASTVDFAPHAKNTFSLEIPEDQKGNYAVSVTDADRTEQNEYADNIKSWLLLHSDISTGLIDPSWYFKNDSLETIKGIDLLMLSSKWTGFDWGKLLSGEAPPLRYFAEKSLLLKGRAFWISKKNKVPMNRGEFTVIIKAPGDSIFTALNVPVDSSGWFTLNNLDYHDTASFYVQNLDSKSDKKISVEFEKNPLDSVWFASASDSNRNLNAFYHSGRVTPSFSRQNVRIPNGDSSVEKDDTAHLKTVTVKASIKNQSDSVLARYATGVFASPTAIAKIIYYIHDDNNENLASINVIQYLEGRAPGLVYYYTDKGGVLIYWRMTAGLFTSASETERIKKNAPAFFLEEAQLNDADVGYDDAISSLQHTMMQDVALIRIFQPGMLVGVQGNAPHGAIVIYLKNGGEGQVASHRKNYDKTTRTGYSKVEEFHTHGSGNTLYWNPNLLTDSVTHNTSFSFINNDSTKHYHIKIEGFDKNGKLVTMDRLFGY
jgi:hypothetical protein